MRYFLTIATDEAIHWSAFVQFAEARQSVDPNARIRLTLEYNDDEEMEYNDDEEI